MPTGSAYDRALALLTDRGYAIRDLRRRLLDHGYAPTEVDTVIERLTATGLVDDAAYARALARSRLVGRRTGQRRIRQELVARGVERGVAEAVLAEVAMDEAVDEAATAERLARQRVTALGALEPATLRRRLYAYLARRGFAPDDIRRAVKRAIAD